MKIGIVGLGVVGGAVRQGFQKLGHTVPYYDIAHEETSLSDEVSSQAWVAEIGLDFTDRINFAVQAPPSRDDLPPLGILTLQANPNLELLGSFDSDGEWKSQVQLFLRY